MRQKFSNTISITGSIGSIFQQMDLSLIPLFFFEKACLFVFMALVFLFAGTSGASSVLVKAPEKQEVLKNRKSSSKKQNSPKQKVLLSEKQNSPKQKVLLSEKQKKKTSSDKQEPLKDAVKDPDFKLKSAHLFEILDREREEPKARGVILKFHRWPNSKKRRLIFKQLGKAGLKKTETIKSFKVWLFEWPKGLRPVKKALEACENLPKMSILDYCEPDVLLPVNVHNWRDIKTFQNERQWFFPEDVHSWRDVRASGTNLKNTFLSLFEIKTVFADLKAKFVLKALSKLKIFFSGYKVFPPFLALGDKQTKDSSNIKTEAEFCFDCPSSEKNRLESLPLNVKSCGLVPHSHNLMEGKLSDYWAQELIGSDLLREELKKTPAPRKRNWISVFDFPIGKHNIMVKNLISDDGAHAVLPELREGKVRLFETGFLWHYVQAASIVKADPPSFINNSMGWGGEEYDRNIYEAFQSLSPPSVLVVAASNDYPIKLERRKSQASKDFHAVVVGSLSPRGFVSTPFQEGEEVHILVPSDDYITSAVSGRYKKFGGTSGATPLVTGSLAGFEWLSGYHPSGEEAKHLLEKTAIPTVHSHEQPQKNGVGMLNSYQLGMLAKRLKRKCGKSSSCFKEEIKKEENYHFNVGEGLHEDVDRAFPACSLEEGQREERQRASCEEKGWVFKKLRQAVLLSPEKRELWEALSCIYREGGFSVNAEGLDRIALSLGSRKELMAGLKKLAEDGDWNVRGHVARVVEKIGGREGFQLLKQLVEDEDRDVRIQVVYVAGEMGGTEGVQLLNQLVEDEDRDVRFQVAYAAGEMGGTEGVQLLNQLVEDEDRDVRFQVAYAAGEIGGMEGIQLLKQLAKDKDRNVRAQVAHTVGEMGGTEGTVILEKLSKDPDPDIQKIVNRILH